MAAADLRTVRVLDGAGAPVAAVGGKAAALDRLIGLGFPVPPAAALSTHAYREIVAQPHVAAAIDQCDSRPPPATWSGERWTTRSSPPRCHLT